MYDLLSVFIIGLSVGGMYALLALGLAMIFAILGLLNLAHGELIAVTAYAMFFLTLTGMPFVVIVMFAVLMAVIGAKRDLGVGAAGIAATRLLRQKLGDERDHIGVASEMRRFVERAVGFLGDVAQMREMDAVGELRGDRVTIAGTAVKFLEGTIDV